MDQPIPDKLYFRIGEVASIVGVDSHVLRYWEKELNMQPHRSNSGQRLYRKVDIGAFLKIKRLIHDEGYTLSGARKALEETEEHTVPSSALVQLREQLLSIKADIQSLRTPQ